MGLTTSGLNTLVDYIAKGCFAIGTSSSSAYIALSTTTPNADGSNFTEPSTSASYTRLNITSKMAGGGGSIPTDSSDYSVPAGVNRNNDILVFNEALANWGTITHYGLFSSATGGTAIYTGAIKDDDGNDTSVTVNATDVAVFKIGQIEITIENEDVDA